MSRIVQDNGDVLQIVETLSPDMFYVLEGKRSTAEWDFAYITANGLGVLSYPYIYRKGIWTSSNEGPPGVSPWMIFEVPPCGVTSLSATPPQTSIRADGGTKQMAWSQGDKKLFVSTGASSIAFSTESSGCGPNTLANIIHYRFGVSPALS